MIGFDASSGGADYFTITDHANLTLPDGQWCLGFWHSETAEAVLFPTWFANNGYSVANSLQIWRESSTNKYWFTLKDADGTLVEASTPSTYAPSATRRLLILQRTAAQIEFYIQAFGAAATLEATGSLTGLTAVNGGDWRFGADEAAADGVVGHFGELFFSNSRSLSSEEISALARGGNILTIAGPALTLYLPFYDSKATENDLIGAHNAARSGTVSPEEHVPVGWGTGPVFGFVSAAAGDQAVAGGTIASTAALFAPTLAHVVAGAHVASTAQLFAPTVAPGAVTVAGAHISSGTVLNPPTVAEEGAQAVEGANIPSGAQLFAPTVIQHVTGGHVSSTAQLFSPTVAPGAVDITGGTIAPGAALFAPLVGDLALLPDVIVATVRSLNAQRSVHSLNSSRTARKL